MDVLCDISRRARPSTSLYMNLVYIRCVYEMHEMSEVYEKLRHVRCMIKCYETILLLLGDKLMS